MCGIAGFITLGLTPDEAALRVRAMTHRIAHRGPDADGHWVDAEAGVALGHRRLSIVDLSPAGAQPMLSHDGRYVIVYNGEVYNHHDLRRELDAEGPRSWRGHSDTEVLLEAVSSWGLESTLRRADGMFAFALYDLRDKVLHLARDRFGEKPLYYGRVGDALVFASELKALRAFPGFKAGIDRDALAEYLRYGYVPAPRSIYAGVSKLPAGSLLSLSAATVAAPWVPVAWWSALDVAMASRAALFTGTHAQAVDELEALLRDAVGRRMEADVPLGALLSGGIDSSTVVALMQAQRSDRVRTFSIGSTQAGYDEAVHARAVADHLGTDHTELYVSAGDALAVIPRLPELYDEPFADSSQVPTFLVSQLARRHVTVALSGDAGDELFGGYNRYFHGASVWRRLGKLPQPVRAFAARAATALSPEALDRVVGALGGLAPRELAGGRAGEKLHKLAGLLPAADQAAFHRAMLSYWPDPERVVLGSHAAVAADPLAGHDDLSFAERAMLVDTLHYLPDDILAKVDRASMGVSLEARVPLLDLRVFEFAWRLPMTMKISGGQGKQVLRDVLYRHVPAAIIDRPKQGFAVPIGQWLRGELRHWAEALIEPARLRREGYFEPEAVQRCWREHQSGQRNWDTRLWTVLMFQAWLEHTPVGEGA